MRNLSPTALYTHCYAHVLNLVIVDSMTNNRVARDFFGTLQNLYVFIENCTKRHAIFVKFQEQLNASNNAETTTKYVLKKLSETRWACRADSIKAIYHTIESVVATLKEVVKVEKKANIYAEAKGLIRSIDFEFILALEVRIRLRFTHSFVNHLRALVCSKLEKIFCFILFYLFCFILFLPQVLKPILFLSKGVSDKLQTKDLDVVTGCERVADLLEAIKGLRNEERFESFWQEAMTKSDQLGIEQHRVERLRKIPKRLDENQDTAVHLDAKDKLRINFYYNVSFLFL